MASGRGTDGTLAHPSDEGGQTMAEYAVVLGVITPAVILVIAFLSGNTAALFDRVTAVF
jgi:Flp pilus assembly pilin Flp